MQASPVYKFTGLAIPIPLYCILPQLTGGFSEAQKQK